MREIILFYLPNVMNDQDVQEQRLPIYELEQQIVDSLTKGNRLILQAPTGSGKSTQVPQILLDHNLSPNGQIIVLQPRRLPTRMLASRIAQERGKKLGDEIGYQIRFEDVSNKNTRVKFITEALLLRQMISDSNLSHIGTIIFDEFHERHIHSDLSLALALQLQKKSRPDLKIIVMSATLETVLLEQYMSPCPVLTSTGRTYPVDIEYLPRLLDPEHEPIWEAAAQKLKEAISKGIEGDALIFMPGAYEINRTIQSIRDICGSKDLIILPLHGELPTADQDAAVARYDKRKVIVSTNVAETSLTIDGVRIVIDSGLARIPRYDPVRGINTLLVDKISLASADQRAGRAGRTAPGISFRLWAEKELSLRPRHELPEIKRVDLSETCLLLKALGVEVLSAFSWVESPDSRTLDNALTLLADLGSLSPDGKKLSEMGRRMLAFPAHPRYARMLLAADQYQCVRPVALIAALTQERNILTRQISNRERENREDILGGENDSDFFMQMRAWRYADRCGYDINRCRSLGIHAGAARQVSRVFEHFIRIAESVGLSIAETPAASDNIRKCVLLGFSDHLAQRTDAGTLRCRIIHNRSGLLARESCVDQASLLVAAEVREMNVKGQIQVILSLVTKVEEEWLKEFFSEDFSENESFTYDESSRKVVSRYERKFRDLVFESKDRDASPSPQAAAILAEQVQLGECILKEWNDAVEQWIVRLNRLAEWCPELALPPIGDTDRKFLVEQICQNAVSYRDIKERQIWPVLKSWLSKEQLAALESYAPERYELPGGRHAKIIYSKDAAPVLSAKIQDLYGVNTNLTIAMGKVPLVIHVLAPNFRPIQVTQDLAVFWKETYPKLKIELQRRYPKHKWL